MRGYYYHSRAAIIRFEREEDERTKAAWINAYLQRVDGDKFPKLEDLLNRRKSEEYIDIDPETNTQIAITMLNGLSAVLPKVEPIGYVEPA